MLRSTRHHISLNQGKFHPQILPFPQAPPYLLKKKNKTALTEPPHPNPSNVTAAILIRLNQPKSPPISLPLIVQERPLGSRCEEEVGRVVGGREYLPGKSIRWRIRTFSAFLSDEG